MKALAGAVIVAFVIVLSAAGAHAQETGGSFGGGDFSGGSSDYSQSSSSDWGSSGSSSSSYDYGSSGGGTYVGGGGCGSEGVGVVFFVLLAIVVVVYVSQLGRSRNLYAKSRSWNDMDVSVLGLAVDWRARKEVQATLMRIARHGDTRSPMGLANMLRETAVALLRVEVSWLYASARDNAMMPSGQAEARFREAAAYARSGFRTEMVRAEAGAVSEAAAPAMRARSEEGEGVVLVTICVAARRELIDLPDPTNAGKIRRALLDMASLGRNLVAVEVIWSPAAEQDRMSTLELETKYPDLRKIDERSIAGRIFCEYCRGPYPAELLKCPHCGAAAPGADAGAPKSP